MPKIVYITGGIQSGKSGFAQSLASKYRKVACIETFVFEKTAGSRTDKRPGPEVWDTFEQAGEIDKLILQGGYDAYILDSAIPLFAEWVYGSTIHKGDPPLQAQEEIEEYVLQSVQKLMLSSIVVRKDLIIISCEAGGLPAYYPPGMFFMALCGKVNQLIALEADEVYFMVSGIPLKLKGDG